jgi:hypothetical protein
MRTCEAPPQSRGGAYAEIHSGVIAPNNAKALEASVSTAILPHGLLGRRRPPHDSQQYPVASLY